MPNWKDLKNELKALGSPHDLVRRKYLAQLSELTERNTIIYYSGWLQKEELLSQSQFDLGIVDGDKTGFMTCINNLDRSKGLDLILHTPGGSMAATESLVYYLREMFGKDGIRAIVPQIAMSGGTMIACACSEIVMGLHSNLGPIDPQVLGSPAHGIVEEFNEAKLEVRKDPSSIPIWQAMLAKYRPALIGECRKAIDWAAEVTTEWLRDGMFVGKNDAEDRAKKVVDELGSHALTKSHDRHISLQRAEELGLEVVRLEDDSQLQDAVLSVHHSVILTLAETQAYKVIENQVGVAFIRSAMPTQYMSVRH